MTMVGLNRATIEANPPGAGIWISNIVATIVPLYTLAWLLKKLGVDSGLRGAGIGLLIAFSFIYLSILTGNLFAQRPYALTWITGGYSMTALTIAGFLLGSWTRKKTGTSEV